MAAEFLAPPPRDFTDPRGMAPKKMRESIRDGRAETAMKPFRGILSDEEIESVAQYIYDAFTLCRLVPTAYHTVENGWPEHREQYGPAFPFVLGEIPLDRPASLLTDRERRGLSLYRGACVICHERDGMRSLVKSDGGNNQSRYGKSTTSPVARDEIMTDAAVVSDERKQDEQPEGDHEKEYGYGLGNGPHDQPPAIPDLTPFEDKGEHLYLDNCAYCHAADGTGQNWIGSFLEPPPPDFTDSKITASYSDNLIRQAIVNGLPDTSMPAFGSVMTEEQVAPIIAYIRRAFMDHRPAEQ